MSVASCYDGFMEDLNCTLKDLLSERKPCKFNDDKIIRDTVFGFNRFYKHEISLIDIPLIQRLRRIHQTALAVLTYPSSTHTRFEHSLGVAGLAEKMLRSLNDRYPPQPNYAPLIDQTKIAEVRLAALLHDCGHGPFSHASEHVYGNKSSVIHNIKSANKELFGSAQPHEILSYCIVTSNAFKEYWQEIVDLYSHSDNLLCDLSQIDMDKVALMILGLKAAKEGYPLYLSQIINGPFDADKLDYLIRDSYFSGLVTGLDIDRLFTSLDVASEKDHGRGHYGDVLCIDIGGATVLEQIQFNKMLLFSSYYHHHKVRSAFRLLVHILESLCQSDIKIHGLDLKHAPSYLLLCDSDLLGIVDKSYPDDVQHLLSSLRNRHLPKRSLVITKNALYGDSTGVEFLRLRDSETSRVELESRSHRNLAI